MGISVQTWSRYHGNICHMSRNPDKTVLQLFKLSPDMVKKTVKQIGHYTIEEMWRRQGVQDGCMREISQNDAEHMLIRMKNVTI